MAARIGRLRRLGLTLLIVSLSTRKRDWSGTRRARCEFRYAREIPYVVSGVEIKTCALVSAPLVLVNNTLFLLLARLDAEITPIGLPWILVIARFEAKPVLWRARGCPLKRRRTSTRLAPSPFLWALAPRVIVINRLVESTVPICARVSSFQLHIGLSTDFPLLITKWRHDVSRILRK